MGREHTFVEGIWLSESQVKLYLSHAVADSHASELSTTH
jgi:hypothetical protein